MNQLKKKAWKELVFAIVAIIWTAPLIFYMAHSNVRGLGWILLCVLVGIPVFVIVFLLEAKELKIFDEREKELIRKSSDVSIKSFFCYLIAFSFLSLFVVGGKGDVPVIILPMMVLTGLFLEQCVRSAILLFRCEKETDE